MNVSKAVNRITLLFFSFLISVVALAQEGGAEVNVDITKDSGSGGVWYNQPLVWIIGAAVFILLLVALLRGNNTARD
jgi:hypothetical protein